MSVWRDEADFMQDIESISEFYISGNHNNPRNKFVFKSKKDSTLKHTPWYESDSDEDFDIHAFGRGRNSSDTTKNPGSEPNHLEIMKEIQMQVRSTVGNRYNNDVLESYYSVYRDEPDPIEDTTSQAPKEISIGYAKEQKLKNASSIHPKQSIAENIEQAASRLSISNNKTKSVMASTAGTSSSTSSTSSSPRKEYGTRGNSRQRYGRRNYKQKDKVDNSMAYSFPFSPPKKEMNFQSKEDFPPL